VPPTLGDRLVHILDAIRSIKDILSKRTEQDIATDLMQRLALERLFEIITEASRHVPPEIRADEPQIDWRKMIDLGNVLRHAYHRVDIPSLIEMAKTDLPLLQAFVERILAEEKVGKKQ
jgi:uncharacterized protein with HEPN domain